MSVSELRLTPWKIGRPSAKASSIISVSFEINEIERAKDYIPGEFILSIAGISIDRTSGVGKIHSVGLRT